MSLLQSTLEQLRNRFADLAKLGRVDAWLAEEPIFDPGEAAAEDWRHLSLVEDYDTLYRWPIGLGVIMYRQPPGDSKLLNVIGPDGRLDFADPPVDSHNRLVVLTKERKRVSISFGAVRKLRLSGDADSAALFGVLAQAAGELIVKPSPLEWKWLSPETVELSDPVWRWILTVFDLAWARVRESGLVPSVDKTWRFPKAVKAGNGSACHRPDIGQPEACADPAKSRPAKPWWYSEIVHLSQSSVFAINILLDVLTIQKRAVKGPARKGISVDEANEAAMKLAKKDKAFVESPIRDWAKKIRELIGKTCSTSTVSQTAFWRTTMKEMERDRSKGSTPKTVSLTRELGAVTGEGERDDLLKKLIAEQEAEANSDPSPLEKDPPGQPRRVRHYK